MLSNNVLYVKFIMSKFVTNFQIQQADLKKTSRLLFTMFSKDGVMI